MVLNVQDGVESVAFDVPQTTEGDLFDISGLPEGVQGRLRDVAGNQILNLNPGSDELVGFANLSEGDRRLVLSQLPSGVAREVGNLTGTETPTFAPPGMIKDNNVGLVVFVIAIIALIGGMLRG